MKSEEPGEQEDSNVSEILGGTKRKKRLEGPGLP
jgi:hypothetical protein